jgi:hypothetical protein
VALGFEAGLGVANTPAQAQGYSAVALGNSAGKTSQDQRSVAVGSYSGETTQGSFSVALGDSAGRENQGDMSVAIGHLAGRVNQGANGIMICSRGTAANDPTPGHIGLISSTGSLYYNGTNNWSFAGGTVTVPNSNLLVGRTSPNFGTGVAGVSLLSSGRGLFEATGDAVLAINRQDGTTSANIVQFYRGNNLAGTIKAATGTAPTFAANSDIRLKDNVVDHESELANVMALRPTRWDWKDSELGTGEGFIAQELEQTAWSDLVSEGDDGFKQVSGLGVVETRLIKAIQEQQAMIETLQAEVAALKGA